jgi:hypothetical protein
LFYLGGYTMDLMMIMMGVQIVVHHFFIFRIEVPPRIGACWKWTDDIGLPIHICQSKRLYDDLGSRSLPEAIIIAFDRRPK